MAKKEITGKVISAYQKTVVVQIDRRVPHPLYIKIINRTSKFYAHDEDMKAKVGDVVRIRETKPVSKLKRWRVVEVIDGGEK